MLPLTALQAYRSAGPLTDLSRFPGNIDELPGDLAGIVQLAQGLMVHIFWAERYGLQLGEDRKAEVQERHAWRKLVRALELDGAPVNTPRPPERRIVGNCRDFSLLTVALLKKQGIPARARCGFGTYFIPGHYEDHWVVEAWDASQARWVQADAQLDALQRTALKITFDPLDLPAGAFLTGGQAWQLCRRGDADPDSFGIFEYKGLDFVRGNLVRDALALQGIELLPWDFWGMLLTPLAGQPAVSLAWLDELAVLCKQVDQQPEALRACYLNTPELHPPAEWLA